MSMGKILHEKEKIAKLEGSGTARDIHGQGYNIKWRKKNLKMQVMALYNMRKISSFCWHQSL